MEVVSSTAAQSLLPMTVLEDSTNVGLPRKNFINKKSPSDYLSLDQGTSMSREHGSDSIRYYSDKLEAIHRENDELERSFVRESNEFDAFQIDLTLKINELKQDLKRKEVENKEQKRKIAELEKHALNSQQKKLTREKLLNEKVSAKEKFEKDISRWNQEVELFYQNVENLNLERNQLSEQVTQELRMQRQAHLQHIQESKLVEEEIHTIGISIEELKEYKKKQESNDWQNDSQKSALKSNESERLWDKKVNKLQSRYTSAWNQLQHAKVLQNQIQQKIDIYSSSQTNSHQVYPPTPLPDDVTERRVYSRHRRMGTNHLESTYPSIGAFVSSSGLQVNAPKSGSPPNESNSLVPKLPFLQYSNRFSFPISQPNDMSPESDSFPGGAISPRAGDLLPAGLLGDDTGSPHDRLGSQKEVLGHAFSTLPGLGAAIPGLGAIQSNELTGFGPNSPSTPASGSPSLLPSPQNGSGNLYYTNTPDYMDQDHRSTRSATSSLKGSATNTLSRASGTKFGNLFGLNRQRGKTLPDSGPAMGTLKSSESQSVPRPENSMYSENLVPRRRGSHSGSGSGQITDLLGDSYSVDEKYERNLQLGLKDGYFRKKAFNMFSGRNDPWAPRINGKRSSPRPSSLGSTDTYFSRPSSQSKQQYGWSLDSAYNRRLDLEQQKLGLAAANPWAQSISRRASFTGSYALLLESDKANLSANMEQIQPPIGTRPGNNKNSAPPKLNPNAPNFKSLFVREKKVDKTGKIEKEPEGLKDEHEEQENILHTGNISDEAQPSTHDLKGNQPDSSIDNTTSRSSHEIKRLDSISDNSITLVSSNSVQGKETFMQKLSRKSSANKFTFSSFKNKDSIFSSRPKERSPVVSTDIETDEESIGKDGDIYLSSSPNTNNGSGVRSGGISWSSIKRMGKRGDKTPSVTESITSIVGDEDE